MKFKSKFIIVILLVIIVQFMSLGVPISKGEDEMSLAMKSGQSFLDECPDFQGATLIEPKIFQNLSGENIAYMYNVVRKGQPLGFIVVGNTAYGYNVLEATVSPLPLSIPSISQAKTQIAKDLQISIEEKDVENPRLVYLGYGSYYAIYTIKGNSIAFDLRTRHALPISDLKNHIVAPEQYKHQKGDVQLSATEKLSLLVPVRNMNDPLIPDDMQNNNNCGPTSAAMIAEYYKIYRGYSRFDNWPNDHNRLYVLMKCNNWGGPGVAPWNAGPGFVNYASEKGYSFSTSYNGASYNDFSNIKISIQSNQPLMVLFWWGAPYESWHYCAVKGYFIYNTSKQIIVNDPRGYTAYVDWDANWAYVTLHWLFPY